MKNLSTIFFVCSILAFVSMLDSSNAQRSWWVNPNNPVLDNGQVGEWDESIAFLANVYVYNDTFYLYYTGYKAAENKLAIGLATSPDGINFTKYNLNPIFEADGNGFDAWGVGRSVVIKVDTAWLLYYDGITSSPHFGPDTTIGLATSVSPYGPWSRFENPVMEIGSSGEWDYGFVDASSIVVTDTGFAFYYTGSDMTFPSGTFQTGLALSADGINWTKYDDPTTTTPPYAESDPVIQPTPGSWDQFSIWGVSVLRNDTLWETFYDGGFAFGYATSPNGVDWTKDTMNPVFTPSQDPHAGNIIEIPSVVLYNIQDTVYYYMYYDYGTSSGIGFARDTDYIVNVETITHSLNSYELYQNFPNPFNPATTIKYQIPEISFVTLKIFDILGNEIETLVNEEKTGGIYESTWNAATLPSGIYFYHLKAGSFVETKKMILLK